MTLTDARFSRHVLPAACRLIGAVRAGDPAEVAAVFEQVTINTDLDPTTAARALAVALAAACPDGQPLAELLAWRTPEYQRLRQAGVQADTAAVLAARDQRTREAG